MPNIVARINYDFEPTYTYVVDWCGFFLLYFAFLITLAPRKMFLNGKLIIILIDLVLIRKLPEINQPERRIRTGIFSTDTLLVGEF